VTVLKVTVMCHRCRAHSSRCGSRSRNTRKAGRAVLTRNVIDSLFIYCMVPTDLESEGESGKIRELRRSGKNSMYHQTQQLLL